MKYFQLFTAFLFVLLVRNVSAQSSIVYSDLYTSGSFSKTIDLDKPVGATAGSASVSPSGAAGYNIPIVCAPGTNGLAPAITLVYSSQAGNGILGQGWSISGLSAITRAGWDAYHYAKVAPVTYSNSDAFVLDGGYLYPKSGTYGATGSKYSTEAESYSIVESVGSWGGGPEYFIVRQRNGSIMEYGHTNDSRFTTDDGSKIMMWRVNRIIDNNGNYIDFEYDNSSRESRIVKIKYTGNLNTGLSTYNEINFVYGTRSDKNTFYNGGNSIKSDNLLWQINVYAEGVRYKTYQMEYGKSAQMQSFLKNIVEFGSDGSSLNDTRFKYGDEANALSENINYDYIMPTLSTDVTSADFDGDGLSDFLVSEYSLDGYGNVYNTNLKIKKRSATSGTYNTISSMTFSGIGVRVENALKQSFFSQRKIIPHHSDFNGDGRDDIMISNFNTAPKSGGVGWVFSLDQISIYYSNSDGTMPASANYVYTPPSVSSAIIEGSQGQQNYVYTGDFDGDGLTDLVTMLGGKIYFHSPGRGIVNKDIAQINLATGTITSGMMSFAFDLLFKEADEVFVVNMDGDAKNELMVVTDGVTRIYTFNFDVSLYDLHMNQVGGNLGYPTTWHDINLGDFNGDGLTDILTGPVREMGTDKSNWEIGFFNGNSFIVQDFNFDHIVRPVKSGYSSTSTDRILISDFNGDGKTDILNFYSPSTGSDQLNMYYSTGKDFTFSKLAHVNDFSIPYSMGIGDFNGDSKADVYLRPEGSAATGDGLFLTFNENSNSHLMTKVTDGYNRTTEFLYNSLSKSTGSADFYQKGSGESYPYNNLQIPFYVVTSMKMPDGVGGVATNNFKYENLVFYRPSGRGILGFQKFTEYNMTADSRTESIFEINRDFAEPYLKTTKTFLNSTGTQLSELNNTVVMTAVGMLRWGGAFSHKQETSTSVQKDLLKGITTTNSFSYDSYSNVLNSTSVTTGGPEAFISTTTSTYTAVAAGLVPSIPATVSVSSQRGSLTAATRQKTFTYDGAGNVLTETEQPIGSSSFLMTTYGYNSWGNTISQLVSGTGILNNDQYFYYDTKGRFVTTEVNSFGDHATTSWHPFWGKPLSQTGVNGLTTSYVYDTWGKLTDKTTPTSGTTSYTTHYSDAWDISGLQLFRTEESDPSGADSKSYYDIQGRIIKTEEEGYSGWKTALVNYNSKGNVVSSTNSYYPSETPRLTTNIYDAYNRISSTTDFSGTTTYAYSASGGLYTTMVTLPDGKVKSSTVDATGKVLKVTNTLTGTVHYEYDSHGNEVFSGLGTSSAAYANLIRREYDDWGRLKKMIDPDAGTITYNYDVLGQLKSMKDAKGRTTSYTYDKAGRLLQSATGPFYKYFTYYGKEKDYRLQSSSITELGSGIYTSNTYEYAVGGGMLSHTLTSTAGSFQKNYTYDIYNRLSTTHFLNSGFRTRNYYTAAGYLAKVMTDLSGGGTEKILYETNSMNGEDQITGFKRVDGLNAVNGFSNGYPVSYNTPGVQALNTSYNYANGNVLSRWDDIAHTNEAFSYDAADRLTQSTAEKMSFSGSPGTSYLPLNMTYDTQFFGSYGRMTSKTDVGNYKYYGFPRNAVASVEDPVGLISHETQNITYTSFDKALKIVESIGGINYEENFVYDATDSRVYSEQSQGGIITRRRVYFGDYEEQTDLRTGVTKKIHYISGADGLCDIVVADGSTGSFSYYGVYTDHLGSITTVSDETGAIVARQSYDAWGRERNPDTWDYPISSSVKPEWLYRGFTGHEMLPEYGLINMNGRMYDPVNGRMLRPDNYVQDPSNSQSFNRYSYCWNNPLKYTDPSGDFITWSVNNGSFSIGINLTPIGIPIGGGINIGYGNGFSGGVYGEVGYRLGGSGFGAGATVSQSLDYNFTHHKVSTTTNVGAYASYGLITVGANASYSYNISDRKGNLGWGFTAGVGTGDGKNGMGFNVGYGSNGFIWGIGGYHDDKWTHNLGARLEAAKAKRAAARVAKQTSQKNVEDGVLTVITEGSDVSLRQKIREYLATAEYKTQQQIEGDLISMGFKRVPARSGSTSVVFRRPGSDVTVRLDPPQAKTPYNHMHVELGRASYNKNLQQIHYKHKDAHMKTK